jgi:hypothetical protein
LYSAKRQLRNFTRRFFATFDLFSRADKLSLRSGEFFMRVKNGAKHVPSGSLIRVTWSGSYAKISVSDDTILKFRIRGICEPEKMKKAKTDFQVSDGFFLALVGIFSFCP